MIEITNVNKHFDDLYVLKDVSLTIANNEVFGLVGPSGVGKSTLLDCLIGLSKYDSGSICIDGIRLEELNEEAMRGFRRKIGMIFQNFSLVSRKDVYHNISLPMECWHFPAKEIRERVERFAELTSIQDKLGKRPDELSGGQKQRVAIARALTMEPRYLLCDECTSALDPKSTQAILALLKNLCEKIGLTIIMVTHEMAVVESICQRMAVLESGRIAAIGDVGEMFRNKPEELRRLLGDGVSEVSITLPSEDLEKCKAFLDSEGMAYKISRGF